MIKEDIICMEQQLPLTSGLRSLQLPAEGVRRRCFFSPNNSLQLVKFPPMNQEQVEQGFIFK